MDYPPLAIRGTGRGDLNPYRTAIGPCKIDIGVLHELLELTTLEYVAYITPARDPKQVVIEITWALESVWRNHGAGVMGGES